MYDMLYSAKMNKNGMKQVLFPEEFTEWLSFTPTYCLAAFERFSCRKHCKDTICEC